MQILLIHRYFWPDSPPYASLLREIGEHWTKSGNVVTVLSTQPSYKVEVDNAKRPAKELVGSLQVLRMPLLPERSRSSLLRGLNSLLFVVQIFLHILVRGGRYDIVMCSTIPPVVTGLATATACKLRRCKFIYHAMDIWPEVAVISNQLQKGFLYRLLRWLDTLACRAATKLVVLSGDMKQTYLNRSKKLEDSIVVLNNFELPVFEEAEKLKDDTKLELDTDRFIVLFAGNIGKYQGLDAVVEAAAQVKDNSVEFLFLGEGAAKSNLIELAKSNGTLGRNVRFLPHQPASVAKQYMSAASLCLVTLAPGVSSVAFPSKTTTILALGTPVAVMVEANSELARMVLENGIGITAECGESEQLASQIDILFGDRDRLVKMKNAAREFGQRESTAASVLPRWTDLLRQVSQS